MHSNQPGEEHTTQVQEVTFDEKNEEWLHRNRGSADACSISPAEMASIGTIATAIRLTMGEANMAYRFLLEVPDALYAQANVVISHTPDAGIVDHHEGIGGDFDNPGKTLTLSAHSLDIAWRLQDWYADVQANMPGAGPVNYLLTNGTRIAVSEADPSDVVALIRRDQPWVERSIPKIGEHITRTGPSHALKSASASDAVRAVTFAAATAPHVGEITILATDEPTDHPNLTIDGATMIHLEAIDLFRAERAYAEVLGTTLVDRADRDGNGGYIWYGAEHLADSDVRTSPEADYAFLQNGPLTIALERMGRAYPIPVHSNVPDPVRLLVADESFEMIKAEALVRNWTVIDDSTPGVFVFRDPYGYTWAIHSESFEKDS